MAKKLKENWAVQEGNYTGTAYIFIYNSSWRETAYIKASNTGEYDQFGVTIAF